MSSTLWMAANLAIWPMTLVLSLRWESSETMDEGIAIVSW
jgi:hypothetical protein